MGKKRVLLIANKWWECDPLLFALLNDNARPFDNNSHTSVLGWPNPLNHPRRRPGKILQPPPEPPAITPAPRAVFSLSNITIEVWCISDLLEQYPDIPDYQSSSELKMHHLQSIFDGPTVDFAIAFGTAGYPSNYTENGSVVVGSRIFIYNGHPNGENPKSNWQGGPFDTIIESRIGSADFNRITTIETSPKTSVLDRFVVPPLNPVQTGNIIARHDYVGVGTVNVTNYSEYETKDSEALNACGAKFNISLAKSQETTHGLIRKQSEAPFIFISGITDRVGHFNEDVGNRSYAQNTSAAHNAGIVAAWLLPNINDLLA